MTILKLHSERFSADGNLSAEGYRKLLGTPSMDLLSILIREATQNSCDAMVSRQGGTARFRMRKLLPEQLAFIASEVLAELPPSGNSGDMLKESLRETDGFWVFEIADFGTNGLEGPVRADVPVPPGETPDFINFFRNVGAARDTEHGGGTYGYGKSTLYQASRMSTIIVDTLTTHAGNEERRIMAAHIGSTWETEKTRYTGRHWWGKPSHDANTVDPVTGPEAERIARKLGFPERGTGNSGTSIMILAPVFIDPGAPEPQATTAAIEEVLLWYFWPRLMQTTATRRRLCCEIWKDSEFRPISRPESFPPISLLVRAMNIIRGVEPSGEQAEEFDIRSLRPSRQLGKMAIVKQARMRRRLLLPPASEQNDDENGDNPVLKSIIPGQCHHIALMRPAELVVRYMEGTPDMNDDMEWGGVFRCDDDAEVEEAFARSEPPAHDDWIPDILEPRSMEKRFVNVALKRIREKLPDYSTPEKSGDSDGHMVPLGMVSEKLGRFLAGDENTRQGPGRGLPGTGGTGSNPAALSPPRFMGLEEHDGKPVAIYEFKALGNSGDSICVTAIPRVIIDGSPDEPDEATGFPRIVSWRNTDGETLYSVTDTAELKPGQYQVLVEMPGDTAITVILRPEAPEITDA